MVQDYNNENKFKFSNVIQSEFENSDDLQIEPSLDNQLSIFDQTLPNQTQIDFQTNTTIDNNQSTVSIFEQPIVIESKISHPIARPVVEEPIVFSTNKPNQTLTEQNQILDSKQNIKEKLLININPKSSFSEAIKCIRTNLCFAAVDKEIKTILLTSPEPGDGKSSISSNLAGAFAQENKKVLIIDCDLRKGRQAEIFGITKNAIKGYTNLILNYTEAKAFNIKDYIESTNIENIDIIPNGPTPPNPVELLASDKNKDLLLQLRELYDIIIFDCPPVIGLSDTLIMTKYSDANIVVVSQGKTKVELLAEVKKSFEKANSTITGVVINKAKQKHNSYYGYYGER